MGEKGENRGRKPRVEKTISLLWINARKKQLIGIIRLTGPKINDYYSLKILLRTKTVQIHVWWVMPRHLCAMLSKQYCKPERIEFFIEAHAQLSMPSLLSLPSSKSERSALRFEARKPVFVKRDMRVCMLDLSREICKPVLKLDFTAHDLMESLSEFQLRP